MQFDQLERREFIAGLGAAVAARPLAAHAQQPTGIRRLGVLLNLSDNDVEAQRLVKAFRGGLAQLGWVEGCNLGSITAGQAVLSRNPISSSHVVLQVPLLSQPMPSMRHGN